jgi:glc operon protein GlcG
MVTIKSLGIAEARTAIAAVVAELGRRNLSATVAVADAYGELIALERLDGSPLAPINIARNKAFTAARERKPSRAIGTAMRHPQSGFDIAFYSDARIIGWGGGVPVKAGETVVGAVAVSGLSEDVDEELAVIGVEAIENGMGAD